MTASQENERKERSQILLTERQTDRNIYNGREKERNRDRERESIENKEVKQTEKRILMIIGIAKRLKILCTHETEIKVKVKVVYVMKGMNKIEQRRTCFIKGHYDFWACKTSLSCLSPRKRRCGNEILRMKNTINIDRKLLFQLIICATLIDLIIEMSAYVQDK